MTANRPIDESLRAMLDAACSDALSNEQVASLEQFLLADEEARRLYLEYFTLEGELHYLGGLMRASGKAEIVDGGQWTVDNEASGERKLPVLELNSEHQQGTDAPSLPAEFGLQPLAVVAPREPIAVVFSHTPWREYVVPCLASAAIMVALGVWAWMSKVSTALPSSHNGQQVAENTDLNASLSHEPTVGALSQSHAAASEPRYVGRITAAADCRWKVQGTKDKDTESGNQMASGERKLPVRKTNGYIAQETKAPHAIKQGANAPRSPIFVALGDRLVVAAGSLEITYDTGARVVLEGPCRFNVEQNGGFLAIGRLTGVMEKKTVVASGQWPVDSAKPQAVFNGLPSPSPLVPSPSFTIATPTALITDLGTEFDVDVANDRTTVVQVIRGEVEATRDLRHGGVPIRERIRAGEAVYIASLNDLPQHVDISLQNSRTADANHAANSPHVVFSPELKKALKQAHDSRGSQTIAKPIGLVATAYHRVFDADGKLLAKNDRDLAFRIATDGVFGRGIGGEDPRSSFDTETIANVAEKTNKTVRQGEKETRSVVGPALSGRHEKDTPGLPVSRSPRLSSPGLPVSESPLSAFVGLRYAQPTRFDRVKVFLAAQTKDGGAWAKSPKLYILKHPIDTNQTPPENDKANWQEMPYQPLFGTFCSPKATPGPGAVLEISLLGFSEEARTGYGWAIGGVPGNGTKSYVSITELRAYTTTEEENTEEHNQKKKLTQSRKNAE